MGVDYHILFSFIPRVKPNAPFEVSNVKRFFFFLGGKEKLILCAPSEGQIF